MTKITEMSAATTPLAGTELIEVVQGGANKKIAASAVAALASTGFGAQVLTPTGVKTGSYAVVAGDLVITDTTSGGFTATLPSSPVNGQLVGFLDKAGTWGTNNLTLGRNSETIDGAAANLVLSAGRYIELVYVQGDGWRTNRHRHVGSEVVSTGGATGETATTLDQDKQNAVVINAKRFVVVGDDATNNDAALLALRDHINLDKTKHYDIFFPPGTYRYTNNRWLYGVGSVRILAHGVTFKNVQAGNSGRDTRPFNQLDIFESYGDQAWPGDTDLYPGFQFETAAVGATTVTLTTTAEHSNFSVGLRVLLHGFDHQWSGYPPNLRFFEWNEITAINTGTGVLTLKYPLSYKYDKNWRDTANYLGISGKSFGKPRITPLVRSGYYYPRYVEFVGCTFARNPNATGNADNGLTFPAEQWVLRRCTYTGTVSAGANRLFLAEDCDFGTGEPDKVVDKALMRRCRMTTPGYTSGGTGCNYLLYEDCTFNSQYLAVSPRVLKLVRNKFIAPAGETNGIIRTNFDHWPISRLVMEDNTIVHDGALRYAVATSTFTYTIPSVSGNDLIVTDDATGRDDVIQRLDIGFILQRTTAAKAGRITDITYNGTNFVLKGTWDATVSGGEVWTWADIGTIEETGTLWVGGHRRALQKIRPRQVAGAEVGQSVTIKLAYPWNWIFGSSNTSEGHDIWGYITAVRWRVLKGYAGSEAGAQVTIDGDFLSGQSTIMYSNSVKGNTLYVTTSVEGSKYGKYADNATDTPTPATLNPQNFCKELLVYYSNAGAVLAGNEDQAIQMSIEVDVIC